MTDPFEGACAEDAGEETHQHFLALLKESEHARWFWARWLVENRSMEVLMKPMSASPTHKQWRDHSDSGDILGKLPGREEYSRYEVRHLIGTQFTGFQDWPYPDFIVTSKHSFDDAAVKPVTYFCLNPEMTHVAYLNVKTSRDDWFVKEKVKNSRLKVNQTFYYSPLSHVAFEEIKTFGRSK